MMPISWIFGKERHGVKKWLGFDNIADKEGDNYDDFLIGMMIDPETAMPIKH